MVGSRLKCTVNN